MDTCDVTQILIDNSVFSNPAFVCGVVGSAMWTVAYVLFVRAGVRDRIYTLPMLAICLNFTWELIAVLLLDNPVPAWRYLEWSWLAIDVVLLGLLTSYGKAAQRNPDLRAHFYPILMVSLALAFVGQYTLITFIDDTLGFITAFVINLIMSVGFVVMFYARPNGRGLSYGAAWLKLFGTLGTSIQCYSLIPAIRCEDEPAAFMTFLYVTIFGFDALYVGLLTRERWRARERRAEHP